MRGAQSARHLRESAGGTPAGRLYDCVLWFVQPFIKDNSRTVGDVVKSAVATIGENIQVQGS